MTETTKRILGRMSNIFTNNEKSILVTIIDALSHEIDDLNINVDRVYRLNNVNIANDDDLYERFGKLLGIYKYRDESIDQYRSRLKTHIIQNTGGTKNAILYSVASRLGVNNNKELMEKYITICDAWDYTGSVNISYCDTSYGNALCIVHPELLDEYDGMGLDELRQIIDKVKASGVNFYIIFVYPILYDDTDGFHIFDEDQLSMLIKDIDNEKLSITDDKFDNIRDDATCDINMIITDGHFSITNSVYNLTNLSAMTNTYTWHDIIKEV